jgi:hypothetical protein
MASGTRTEASKIAALDPSRWIVKMRRAILAFATLIALSQTATAGVLLFGHVSCAAVRFYVAKYSEAAAERWARSHGASGAEIETARRCLHGATVQTASSAATSQVRAPVTEQERAPVTEQEPAQHEPAERAPDQDALRVVSVQGQRADPEQDKVDNEPAHHFIRPEDIEDRSAGHVSQEIKYLPPSDRKKRPLRGSARMTSHVAWFKRLWDNLTRRHQLKIAFLHFRAGRQ